MVEVIDRELPPITVDELNTMLDQSVAAASVRRFSGPLVAVAVAAIALLLGGGVALLFNNPDEIQLADTVVPPTTIVESSPTTLAESVPTTLPLSVPTVILADLEGVVVGNTEVGASQVSLSSIGDLRLTPFDDLPPGLTAGGVVVTPVGIVAVSSDGELLVSDDGIGWRSVASPFPGRLVEVYEQFGVFYLAAVDGDTTSLWKSFDFVTWALSPSGPAQVSPSGLSDWLAGPEFLRMWSDSPYQEYAGPAVTPQGSLLVFAEWRIDWASVAEQVGGDAMKQRFDEGERLGPNSWNPATGIVDFTIFESQTAADAFYRNHPEGSPGPEPLGLQLRLSVTGTVTEWVVEFEDVARRETLGVITGSLPPVGREDPAGRLPSYTLADIVEFVATAPSGIGAHFLLSEDRFELVESPPWVGLSGEEPTFFLQDGQLHANWFFQDSGAWRTPDGRVWFDVADQETLIPAMAPGEVIQEGPGGVLIMSADMTQPSFDVEGQPPPPFLHRSINGVDWAPPTQPPTFVGDQPGPFAVTATDTGFLLVARVQEARSGTDGPSELIIWTSTDGDIWEQVDLVLPDGPPLDDIHENLEVISGRNFVLVFGQTQAWIIQASQ